MSHLYSQLSRLSQHSRLSFSSYTSRERGREGEREADRRVRECGRIEPHTDREERGRERGRERDGETLIGARYGGSDQSPLCVHPTVVL